MQKLTEGEEIVIRQKNDQFELDEFLEDLKFLVNMDTSSNKRDLTNKATNFIEKRFKKLVGGEVEYFPKEHFGNHMKLSVGQGNEQILILGHIDTVWPEDEVSRRPFTVKNEIAYGPGIFDMKCGVIQGLYAIKDVVKSQSLTKKIVYLINTDEEVGSPTSRKLIENEARKSKAVFVLEPAMGLQGSLKTSRKGVGRFTLTVKGVPAHSGIDHQKGRNANEELAQQIIKLQSLTNYGKGTTVNVGMMSGGSAVNVVSPHAQAKIDLRVETNEEGDRLTDVIKGLSANDPEQEITVEGGMVRPPLERKNSEYLFEQAKEIAEEMGIEISEASTGGGSDGCFTANLGIPTLDGLGAVGNGAHAFNEYVEINKIKERTFLLVNLLNHLNSQ